MTLARTIIITGCEDHYVPLLAGLIGSIEGPARTNQIDIGLLDFGLRDECRKEYARRGVAVVTPEWDFDQSLFHAPPADYFKAMTSRPHLRKYFPGYDCYLWMDADSWVQDWSGVELYIASAEAYGLAVTPEVDRSYAPIYSSKMAVIQWRRECYLRCFDEDVANRLALYPTINSGVFAARADAPIWDIWSHTLGQIFQAKHEAFFFAEQSALNAGIRLNGLRTAFLPLDLQLDVQPRDARLLRKWGGVAGAKSPFSADQRDASDRQHQERDMAIGHRNRKRARPVAAISRP